MAKKNGFSTYAIYTYCCCLLLMPASLQWLHHFDWPMNFRLRHGFYANFPHCYQNVTQKNLSVDLDQWLMLRSNQFLQPYHFFQTNFAPSILKINIEVINIFIGITLHTNMKIIALTRENNAFLFSQYLLIYLPLCLFLQFHHHNQMSNVDSCPMTNGKDLLSHGLCHDQSSYLVLHVLIYPKYY